jgi:hypothetical protein
MSSSMSIIKWTLSLGQRPFDDACQSQCRVVPLVKPDIEPDISKDGNLVLERVFGRFTKDL